MTLDMPTLSIIVGFMVLYTKVVFDYSRIKTELQSNTTVLTKIEILLSNHNDKLDLLEKRITVLETREENQNRRKGDL